MHVYQNVDVYERIVPVTSTSTCHGSHALKAHDLTLLSCSNVQLARINTLESRINGIEMSRALT